MTDVVLFHSVLGLRPAEHRAAELLRAEGHRVSTPDLYAGRVAATVADGFAIMDRTGWEVIVRRAHDAIRDLPARTVLAGFSMGCGVVDEVLPHRPETAGVLLLHGLAGLPATVRPGLPVQVHVADPDPFAPPDRLVAWRATADTVGAAARVFTHPGAGHFYTDADLSEHDERAASRTWDRVRDFLATLGA